MFGENQFGGIPYLTLKEASTFADTNVAKQIRKPKWIIYDVSLSRSMHIHVNRGYSRLKSIPQLTLTNTKITKITNQASRG